MPKGKFRTHLNGLSTQLKRIINTKEFDAASYNKRCCGRCSKNKRIVQRFRRVGWIWPDLDCWSLRINDINCGFATTVISPLITSSSRSLDSGQQTTAAPTSPEISLNQIQSLTGNQKVNIRRVITLGDKPPKEVSQRNGQIRILKEDCIREDLTGYAIIHLWDETIKQV